MKLADFSVERPIFISMLACITLVLGGISLKYLPVDLFPEIDFPACSITTFYDDASPQEVEELIDFLLPYYIEEGKLGLTIAVGCTGGRHRSVAIAAELNKYLNIKGIGAVSVHRDMER